jgi:leucyl-tRNA synthetase
MFRTYNPYLRKISQDLRKNQTEAEIEMWNFLKSNYTDIKFNRQLPIDNFVVDFICKRSNLIIEIDGEIHNSQREKDKERDNILLLKYSLKTIRFTNEQVLNEKEYLRKILDSELH